MTTKTECKQGHPMEGDNLYVSPRGRRGCKACDRERQRRRRREGGGRHGERLRSHRETLLRVSNAPMRERYLQLEAAGEITAGGLALRLGWHLPERGDRGKGDGQRVLRTLGLAHTYEGRTEDGERFATLRRTVLYETGVKVALALGMDPFEAGV